MYEDLHVSHPVRIWRYYEKKATPPLRYKRMKEDKTYYANVEVYDSAGKLIAMVSFRAGTPREEVDRLSQVFIDLCNARYS